MLLEIRGPMFSNKPDIFSTLSIDEPKTKLIY